MTSTTAPGDQHSAATAGPSGRRRAFLVGYYGVDNLGDDAIRESIERAGRELGSDVLTYATRVERPDDPRAVRLRGPTRRRYLRSVLEADVVLIGGGGLLKDQGVKPWQGYGMLLELLGTAGMARLLGKPVVLVGMGVGPVYSAFGGWLIKQITRLANRRLVRDQDSADVLASLGMSRKVEVHADPVFSMRSATIASAGQAHRRQWPPRRVVISARPWYHMTTDGPERWSQLVGAIAKVADEAIEDGADSVEFACLFWPEDEHATREIAAEMRYGERVRIPTAASDWWSLAGELRDCDLLVSMRYHAIVCAAIIGTPVFALAYEPKVVALAEALDLTYVDINDPASVESIADRLRAFRQTDTPAPGASTMETATEQLSLSARRGLTAALSASLG
jgi:polysaccharide pyruvyl transferase CsaB